MGICQNCIYKSVQKLDCPNLHWEDYLCLNEKNAHTDYITGKTMLSSCRSKNNFGECLHMIPAIPFSNLKQVKDYLFQAEYDVLDFDYLDKYTNETFGMCTAVRKGNFYGRNYDWLYDETATFVVKVSGNRDRYASVGIASHKSLTKEFVESVIETSAEKNLNPFRLLPFYTLDGINEKGVTASINVVPADKGNTVGTNPEKYIKEKLNVFYLVRYIIDHFSSAQEAIKYLNDYVSVFCPKTDSFRYECHLMVADSEETYSIEFINNKMVITKLNKPYMTNFHLEGVEFDEETGHIINESVEDFGMGIERYDIITDSYEAIENIDDMSELMRNLFYTKAYTETENPWYTEFVGDYTESGHNVLTTHSEPSEFAWILDHERTRYAERSRDIESENFGTWQTVHSSVYDISTKTLRVFSQEGNEQFTFTL